jgi:putative SOS response-associated peptidase YedK
MCVNYSPPPKDTVARMTGADVTSSPDWPEDVWQDAIAPIVRADARGAPELLVGSYGMIPRERMPQGVRLTTMNARAETIGERRSYATAWRRAQTCLVPARWFCEPNYEAGTGRAERWAIGMDDGAPFCVAGLWCAWDAPDGGIAHSFTQITINADAHSLMCRFQKPGDEKRSLVIIPPQEYDAWLNAGSPELARSMLRPYPAADMKAWPLPATPPATRRRAPADDSQASFGF